MALGLKVVGENGKPESSFASANFRWNLEIGGITRASDWNPIPKCGKGLHIWPWGCGNLYTSKFWIISQDIVQWLVVEYDETLAINLDGKIKVPEAKTVFLGSRSECANYIYDRRPVDALPGKLQFGVEKTFPNHTANTLGAYCTGKVDRGRVTVGNGGVAHSGMYGVSLAGDYGKAISGDYGKAISDDHGVSQSGYYGKAKAGYAGKASVGFGGIAIAGNNGIVRVGQGGKGKVGKGGILKFEFDESVKSINVRDEIPGYGKIKPDTFYTMVKTDVIVEVLEESWDGM